MTSENTARTRLLKAWREAAPPAAFVEAFTGEPPEPQAGQLWRVRRDDVLTLVLLIAVGAVEVTAAPVTLDVQFADEEAVTIPASCTALQRELVIWFGLTRSLPMRRLECYAGPVTSDGAVSDEFGTVESLRRVGRAGRAPVTAADPLIEYRARLEDDVAALAQRPVAYGTGELPRVLSDVQIEPERLAEVLTATPQRVFSLLQGTAALTPHEADVLGNAVHRDPAELLNANPSPPQDLVAALERPRRRAQILRLAETRNVHEDTAREIAAYGAFASAARSSGDPSSPWEARLDRYFQAVLP